MLGLAENFDVLGRSAAGLVTQTIFLPSPGIPIASTALRAILHFVPHAGPFFAPGERAAAHGADLFGEMLLFHGWESV